MHLVRAIDVDTAFGLMLAVDWLWLWASGRLVGVVGVWWRLLGAAALAAGAGVWAEFPSGAWLRLWPVKLMLSGLWLLAAYAGRRGQGRVLPRLFVAFLGVGAAMAGAGIFLTGGRSRGMALVPISPGVWTAYAGPAPAAAPLLLLGIALAVIGGQALIKAGLAWRRHLRADLVQVEVGWNDRMLKFSGLVDTGNELREPLSGRPVIVVEATALAQALPPDWAADSRKIPYRSVGAAGWLLAVAPGRLLINGCRVQAYLALAPAPVHPAGRFQALVPSALVLEKGISQ